ncbi:hypothetical protein DFH06DRAFT_1266812 [Mycena polygramma]|nr:hypothetical protein DFH06DRAFT_1266812 [Mycena polygramma]
MEGVMGRGRGSYIYGRSVHNIRIERLWVNWTNGDAQEWADAWNSHKITMEGQKKQSPREMFTFGLLEQGPRGIGHLLPAEEEAVTDFARFGVDWEAQTVPGIVNHLANNNAEDWDSTNPFTAYSTLAHMSEVIVEPPHCPFTAEQIAALDAELALVANVRSREMSVRKVVWQEALAICRRFYE